MKNKTVCRILCVIAALCVAYYIALLLYEPNYELSFRQALLFVTSFSNVWLLLALLCLWASHHILRRGKESRYVFMQDFPRKARVAVVAVVAFGVCVCAVALSFILRPRIDEGGGDEAQFVIVLGGGVFLDGSLPRGVREKLAVAAAYAQEHPQAKVIVAGGKTTFQRLAESPFMAGQLEELGVAAERIFAEDQSEDTIQNLRNSAAIIAREAGVPMEQALALPVVIITHRFHMRRAQILAGRLGFQNVRGVPARIQPVNVLASYTREICSYVKLALRIILTGEPSSLAATHENGTN